MMKKIVISLGLLLLTTLPLQAKEVEKIEFNFKISEVLLNGEGSFTTFDKITYFKTVDDKYIITEAPSTLNKDDLGHSFSSFRLTKENNDLREAFRTLKNDNSQGSRENCRKIRGKIWFIKKDSAYNIKKEGNKYKIRIINHENTVELVFGNLFDIEIVLGSGAKAHQVNAFNPEKVNEEGLLNFSTLSSVIQAGEQATRDNPLLIYKKEETDRADKWSEVIVSWNDNNTAQYLCLHNINNESNFKKAFSPHLNDFLKKAVDALDFKRIKSIAYEVKEKLNKNKASRLQTEWDKKSSPSKNYLVWAPQNRYQNVWFTNSIPSDKEKPIKLGPSQLGYKGLGDGESEGSPSLEKFKTGDEKNAKATYYPATLEYQDMPFILITNTTEDRKPFYIQQSEFTVNNLCHFKNKQYGSTVARRKIAEKVFPPPKKDERSDIENLAEGESIKDDSLHREKLQWEQLSTLPEYLIAGIKEGREDKKSDIETEIGPEFIYIAEVITGFPKDHSFQDSQETDSGEQANILKEHRNRYFCRIERYFELRALSWLDYLRNHEKYSQALDKLSKDHQPFHNAPEDIPDTDSKFWKLAAIVFEKYVKQYGGLSDSEHSEYFTSLLNEYYRKKGEGSEAHNPLDEPVVFISPAAIHNILNQDQDTNELKFKLNLQRGWQFRAANADKKSTSKSKQLRITGVKSDAADKISLGGKRKLYGMNSNVSEWVALPEKKYGVAGKNWRIDSDSHDLNKKIIDANSNAFSSVIGFRLALTNEAEKTTEKSIDMSKNSTQVFNKWYEYLYDPKDDTVNSSDQLSQTKMRKVEGALGNHDFWHEEFIRTLLFAGYVLPADGAFDDLEVSRTSELIQHYLK